MQGTNWVKVSDLLPRMGEPLLIIVDGKIRTVTYFMDMVDCAESYRFFEFSDCGNDSNWESIHCVSHYMYVRDIPMPEGE